MTVESETLQQLERMLSEGKTTGEIRVYLAESNPIFLAENNPIPRQNIRNFISECASKFRINFPVVDIGCGYRSNKPEIALSWGSDPTFKYIAFDHSADFDHPIDPKAALDLLADALQVPFPDFFASTVVCTEVLEHVADDRRVLQEVFRILKNSGLFILTLPGKDIPKHEKLPYQVDYRRYNQEQITRLLSSFGFRDIEVVERCFAGFQVNIFATCKKP